MKFPSKLRVSLMPDSIFMTLNESSFCKQRVSGLEGEFLNIISNHFKFEYDIIVPKEAEYGRNASKGNWIGIMGVLARDEADLAINWISMDSDRMGVVDFGNMYATEEIIYIVENLFIMKYLYLGL